MDCRKVEQWMSEYLDSSLPAGDMSDIKAHLDGCPNCSALLQEVQSVISLCGNLPELEMDLRVVDKVLLRTSGRSRTRSFKELLNQYFIRPMMTPRLAAGACLAVLFLVLMLDLMIPKLSVTLSSFSPGAVFRVLDRGAQQLYGEGLRAYNKKNEWEDQYNRFKNNAINSLRSIMDQLDTPVEGRKKTEEPRRQKEAVPKEERSHLLQLPA